MTPVTIFESIKANRWKVAATSASQRIEKLRKLESAIESHGEEIEAALKSDLNRAPLETRILETTSSLAEIRFAIRNLKSWMRPRRVPTPLSLFGSRSEIRYEPKGVCLIISPWNYPFFLMIAPLVGAICAGDCAILKPSELAPATAAVLAKICAECFPADEIAVVQGGPEISTSLLALPFDHFFYTGGGTIGRIVMRAAAEHLSSVTLELGGKSPAIIDASADLKTAARRIAWGKFINAGQTCVAPDFVLVPKNLLPAFLRELKTHITLFYGQSEEDQLKCGDYARIINDKHFLRLKKLLDSFLSDGARVETGGQTDPASRYIAPTILTGPTDLPLSEAKKSAIMQEEIFGPLLPVFEYESRTEVLEFLKTLEKPLALYIFSENQASTEEWLRNTTSGGTCINEVAIHLVNPHLPFGGVGPSGTGAYHGIYSFLDFSHSRSILQQPRWSAIRLLHPPYNRLTRWVIRILKQFI